MAEVTFADFRIAYRFESEAEGKRKEEVGRKRRAAARGTIATHTQKRLGSRRARVLCGPQRGTGVDINWCVVP